jgi:hypothetical protein
MGDALRRDESGDSPTAHAARRAPRRSAGKTWGEIEEWGKVRKAYHPPEVAHVG